MKQHFKLLQDYEVTNPAIKGYMFATKKYGMNLYFYQPKVGRKCGLISPKLGTLVATKLMEASVISLDIPDREIVHKVFREDKEGYILITSKIVLPDGVSLINSGREYTFFVKPNSNTYKYAMKCILEKELPELLRKLHS